MNYYTIQTNRDAFFSRHPSGVYRVSDQHNKKDVIDEIAEAIDPPLNKSCTNNEIDWTDNFSGVEDGYWWVGVARGVVPQEIIHKYNLVKLNRKEVA